MRTDDELLTIGEVAKIDGTSTKALRYYDAHGILPPPRNRSAHRISVLLP